MREKVRKEEEDEEEIEKWGICNRVWKGEG